MGLVVNGYHALDAVFFQGQREVRGIGVGEMARTFQGAGSSRDHRSRCFGVLHGAAITSGLIFDSSFASLPSALLFCTYSSTHFCLLGALSHLTKLL
jgi:hypothetical protein